MRSRLGPAETENNGACLSQRLHGRNPHAPGQHGHSMLQVRDGGRY